jgi:microcystin-dependent protein
MAKTALRRGSQDEGNSEYFTGCPIGGGFIWFGLPEKIPSNCRVCDNSTLAISQFAKLYENMAGSWGTDGTNINLPDLRGRFPRGVDGDASRDPDKASRTAANTGGNTGDAVGSAQDDAMQGHWHTYHSNQNFNVGASAGYARVPRQTGINADLSAPDVTNSSNSPIRNAFSDGTNGTPRTTGETRPKNANVYFVIRVS